MENDLGENIPLNCYYENDEKMFIFEKYYPLHKKEELHAFSQKKNLTIFKSYFNIFFKIIYTGK